MANIDTLKTYLQIEDSSLDSKLAIILGLAEQDYLDKTHQTEANDSIVLDMAIERYNQLGNEGISQMNYSGISEAFRTDYSDKVKGRIRSKTRMVTR